MLLRYPPTPTVDAAFAAFFLGRLALLLKKDPLWLKQVRRLLPGTGLSVRYRTYTSCAIEDSSGTRWNRRRDSMSRRVLLIDDKLSDRTAIVDALADCGGTPFPLLQVGLLAEVLERLSRGRTNQTTAAERIAAIIVDLVLPDSNGIGTFDQLFQATPN